MTINLGQGYVNDCYLDHLQNFDMSKGVDRDGGYDNDKKAWHRPGSAQIGSGLGSLHICLPTVGLC